MHRSMVSAAVALLIVTCCCPLQAEQHTQQSGLQKRAILLVAFGTTHNDALKAYDMVEARVRQAFPDVPLRWAYTSRMVRHKLAQKGQEVPSPAQALASMLDEGIERVAVQSLHVIPGSEYRDLCAVVRGFRLMPAMKEIVLGRPLLGSQADMERVRKALEAIASKESASHLFIGHGTHHPSNAFYTALAYRLEQGGSRAFLGTVEGYPDRGTVFKGLRASDRRKVVLHPFMVVAGDHAKNDIAGPGSGSWKSELESRGYACEAVLKGLGEYESLASIWVDHLRSALEQ